MINNERDDVSVVMERPIDSSGNLFRRRKRDGRKRKKGAAAAGYARQPKNQLTAVERRDSDRKRNTPMIIGSCRKKFRVFNSPQDSPTNAA